MYVRNKGQQHFLEWYEQHLIEHTINEKALACIKAEKTVSASRRKLTYLCRLAYGRLSISTFHW